MKKAELTLPEISLIAGTRGMLGAGAVSVIGRQTQRRSEKGHGVDIVEYWS